MSKRKMKPFAFDDAPLRAALTAMSDDDLKTFAAANRVDISTATSREAIEAAIVVAAEANAKAAYDAEAAKPVPKGAKLDRVQTETVRRVWTRFSANVPYKAQSSGRFEATEEDLTDERNHGVPDGRYRVLGADWILIFDGGWLVEAEKATTATDGASYQEIA